MISFTNVCKATTWRWGLELFERAQKAKRCVKHVSEFQDAHHIYEHLNINMNNTTHDMNIIKKKTYDIINIRSLGI